MCISLRQQLIGLTFVFSSLCLHGQTVADEQLGRFKNLPLYPQVRKFYALNDNRLLWIGKPQLRAAFVGLLRKSSSLGLHEQDCDLGFLANAAGITSPMAIDTVVTDVRFTHAALHFFSELKAGNAKPSFGYNGLVYPDIFPSLLPSLQKHLSANTLTAFAEEVQPKTREYANALQKLNCLQQRINEPGFQEVKITSSKADSGNTPLLLKLYQLGFSDNLQKPVNKEDLHRTIVAAQTEFNLLNDGTLRGTTLAVLNVPVAQRIEELAAAVNVLRWVETLKQTTPVLLLNLPAAVFFLYDNGQLVLNSRVIVGKPSTPTPTLTSTITDVVLYPYWNVPGKIAAKELLPSIKKNVRFLELGNFQVLDRTGRVLNPYRINWHAVSSTHFPYFIRQSTGCDNALGLVKFDFYNPFSVYLHDTPTKLLFASARRFYSHGCMRVEKPEELARYLLGGNRIAIDTLTAKGCINQQAPVVVKVEKSLPVVVLYSTIWYTAGGEIRFYNDVYRKLNFNKAIAFIQ